MTPAEHETAAEAAIATLSNTTTASTFTFYDRRAAAVHAQLAQTAGTGAHYTAADTAVAAYDNGTPHAKRVSGLALDVAELHAALADR